MCSSDLPDFAQTGRARSFAPTLDRSRALTFAEAVTRRDGLTGRGVVIGVLDSGVRMGFLIFLPFLLAAKGAELTTVGFALTLVFLLFPAAPRFRHRLRWWDMILAAAAIAIAGYILYWGDELGDRHFEVETVEDDAISERAMKVADAERGVRHGLNVLRIRDATGAVAVRVCARSRRRAGRGWRR